MAFASKPTGDLVFDLLDETGDHGKTKAHFPIATTVANVFTAADALVPLLQALTGCTVLGYSASYGSRDTAPAAPAAGSRVENKGLFVFNLANTLTSRMEVPGILQAVLLEEGLIDVENSDVAAFLTAVISGSSIFRGVDASDIVSVRSAYQHFRATTRRQLPSGRSAFGG